VKTLKQVLFFANPRFFPSPPKPFQLLVYVEAISSLEFAILNPRPTSRVHLVDPRILEFIDDCALELDSKALNNEGSLT